MSAKSKKGKASAKAPTVIQCGGSAIGLPLMSDVGYRSAHESHRTGTVKYESHLAIYVLEGHLRTRLEDGRILDARGGMMYTIAAGVAHEPDEAAFGPVENVWMGILPPRAGCAMGSVFDDAEYEQLYRAIAGLGCDVWHMPKALIASLRSLASVLGPVDADTTPYRLPELRAAICKLLVGTVHACAGNVPARETEFARAIEQYVTAHYGEELSLSRIAEHMGYDPTWLRKRFKRESGYTLNHYIQDYRVSVAKQMLRETEREITDIALESGFGSSQYFCYVFRKITGMTASAYRKRRSTQIPKNPNTQRNPKS